MIVYIILFTLEHLIYCNHHHVKNVEQDVLTDRTVNQKKLFISCYKHILNISKHMNRKKDFYPIVDKNPEPTRNYVLYSTKHIFMSWI